MVRFLYINTRVFMYKKNIWLLFKLYLYKKARKIDDYLELYIEGGGTKKNEKVFKKNFLTKGFKIMIFMKD
jgi:hypothetical protein